MNTGPRSASILSALGLVTALLVTGCSTIAAPDFELPSISLGESPIPSVSPSPDQTAQPDQSKPTTSESPTAEPTREPERVSDGFAELDMEDQAGDGLSVEIEEVRLSLGKGILVIFDNQGQVLGSSQVMVKTQPVAITLTSPIQRSQKLVAQLFLDNGNGSFDQDLDTPILDHDGDLARESFEYKLSQG